MSPQNTLKWLPTDEEMLRMGPFSEVSLVVMTKKIVKKLNGFEWFSRNIKKT